MKVIRFFVYIIPILTAFLSSCEKQEVSVGQGGTPIYFDAAIFQPVTKADYSTSLNFGTYAWKTSSDWDSTDADSKLSSPYIVNAKTEHNGTNWSPGNYVWPSAGKLHFACYAPYKESSPMTFSVTDSICFNGYEVCGDDLLYSSFLTDKDNNDETQVAFKHALCKILLKVKTDGVPTGLSAHIDNVKVYVDSLIIGAAYKKGDFKQHGGWSNQSGTMSYHIISSPTELSSTNHKDSCYVIPQTLNEDLQYIQIGYHGSVTYKDPVVTKSFSSVDKYFLKSINFKNLEMGKAITFDITVSAFAEMSFTARVDKWTDQVSGGTIGGGGGLI